MLDRIRRWIGNLAKTAPVPRTFEPAVALAVEGAIERLRGFDQQTAEVVKLRLLEGLSLNEVASKMQLSRAIAKREWVFGKAWMRKEIAPKGKYLRI